MIRTALLFSLLVTIQCSTLPNSSLLIGINSTANSCYNYFTISPRLESDPEYARQLSSYLYSSLVGGFECSNNSDSMKMLFKRESFAKSIYLFFLDSSYTTLNHYDNSSRWIEGYDNLLRNCSDSLVVYGIADSLLHFRKDNGFVSLWKGSALNKLHNFKGYIDWCVQSDNLDGPVKAVIVLHNGKDLDSRDSLINELRKSQSFMKFERKLIPLLEKHSFVSYELFAEEMYDGV